MSGEDEAVTNRNEEKVMRVPDPYARAMSPQTTATKGWSTKVEKLHFGSLDDADFTIVAQYNPSELQIDKQIQWKKPERVPGSHPGAGEHDEMELTTAPVRSMNLALLFDGFEEHRSVQPEIDMLETMSNIREPGSKHAYLRRAHHCVVAWGRASGAKRFRCVIESLSTKVTMFSPEGEPLRALCTMKLQEVNMLSKTDHD